MKERPISAVERVARLIDKRNAESAAKRDRALAEYDRIVARLRRRPPPADSAAGPVRDKPARLS